jgi:hypothetical protein
MPTEAEVEKLSIEIRDAWRNYERLPEDDAWKAVARHILSHRKVPSLDDIPTQFLARAMWRAVWPEHEFPEEILGVWDKAAERLKAWVRKQRS